MTLHPDEQARELETFACNWRNYLLAEREYFSKMDELETLNNHEAVARAWSRATAHVEDNLGRITELLKLAAAPSLHKEGAGGVCGQPISPGLCEYTCTKEPGHAGEHNWVLGELLARMVAPLPLQRTLPDEQFKGAVVEAIVTEARCNYYFGGFDGGNRCQLSRGHSSGTGHIWRVEDEVASPAGRAEQEQK